MDICPTIHIGGLNLLPLVKFPGLFHVSNECSTRRKPKGGESGKGLKLGTQVNEISKVHDQILWVPETHTFDPH